MQAAGMHRLLRLVCGIFEFYGIQKNASGKCALSNSRNRNAIDLTGAIRAAFIFFNSFWDFPWNGISVRFASKVISESESAGLFVHYRIFIFHISTIIRFLFFD